MTSNSPETRLYPPVTHDGKGSERPLSLVVVHYSDEIHHNILKSSCVHDQLNELIIVDNRFNLFFGSLGAAINSGIDRAANELLAIVHEDVLLQVDWQAEMERSLAELESADPEWGIAGAVGGAAGVRGSIGHWSDPFRYRNTLDGRRFIAVDRLDEQLLIFRKSIGLRFDPNLPNIHNLGRDVIRTLQQQGRRAYVINAPTIHKFANAEGKLIQSPDQSPKIRGRSWRTQVLMRECSDDYFFLKWGVRPRPGEEPRVPIVDLPRPPSDLEPIIFLGRGGSGTRLLSDLADALGIFLGSRVNRSGDSLDVVHAAYKGIFQKFACTDQQQRDLTAPTMIRAVARLADSIEDDSQAYGVKLPELILLVPELAAAFPRARFIRIVRDPVDCSVRRLHPTSRIDHMLGRCLLPHAYRWVGRDCASILDDHPMVRAACTTVHQMEFSAQEFSKLSAKRHYVVRFEDLIRDFAGELEKLATWLGRAQVKKVPVDINPARANVDPSICPEEVLATVRGIVGRCRTVSGYHDR